MRNNVEIFYRSQLRIGSSLGFLTVEEIRVTFLEKPKRGNRSYHPKLPGFMVLISGLYSGEQPRFWLHISEADK